MVCAVVFLLYLVLAFVVVVVGHDLAPMHGPLLDAWIFTCAAIGVWLAGLGCLRAYGGLEKMLCAVLRTREIHKPEGLYLRRFYLSPRVRWLLFQIFLHHILLDDDRHLHDHPFDFVTIILRGSYRETIRRSDGTTYERVLTAGSIRFNRAEHTHRLEIIRPVWSLVIASRPRRKWGFWTDEPDQQTGKINHKWTPADAFLNDPTVYDWPEDRL